MDESIGNLLKEINFALLLVCMYSKVCGENREDLHGSCV